MHPILRKTFYVLPVSVRYTIRRILYLPEDVFRKRNAMMPPKGMIFTGSGNYIEIGAQFFTYFKKYGALTPESAVLDIGSGIGRMAVPFTTFLSEKGRYEGFDIVKKGVDWCQNNISKRFPNFTFKLIPLKNDLYNLSTDNVASELRFPYENERFDFVFLTSVFTHMMPADLENYVREIQRVLQPGKKCLATFFLLDDESEGMMKERGDKSFPYPMGDYSLMDKSVKEANVAYQKSYVLNLLAENGFEVTHFFRGSWSGIAPSDLNEHQDILIIKKN
ncbi:class I SAM-dependent methyltransferase [Flavobacterium sp. 25HG05S-40]|uniref:class I SAM-dependent methyltransferase n=1 Tax=Flavobacterium sp. 25HG05S-40 TaxID=3458682 RepID=UPI004043A192